MHSASLARRRGVSLPWKLITELPGFEHVIMTRFALFTAGLIGAALAFGLDDAFDHPAAVRVAGLAAVTLVMEVTSTCECGRRGWASWRGAGVDKTDRRSLRWRITEDAPRFVAEMVGNDGAVLVGRGSLHDIGWVERDLMVSARASVRCRRRPRGARR